MSITTRTIENAQAIERVESLPLEPTTLVGRGVALDRVTAGLIALLVAGVATDRLEFGVGSFNVRSEFIVGALVALVALIRLKGAAIKLFGVVDACLAGWLGVNIVSSLLFSPDSKESFKFVALLVGLLTIYAATRLLVRPGAAIEWAAFMFVGAGATVALVGLGYALLFRVIGPNPGVLLERFYKDGVFTVTPKVQSLLWEPNIYGSFSLAVCAIIAALALARLRLGREGAKGSSLIGKLPLGWLYVASAAGMCGVMLSMTRTVWLIGPVVVGLMAVVAWRLKLADARHILLGVLLPPLVGGLVGLGVGVSLPAPRWEMGPPWDLTPAQVDDMVRERLFGTSTNVPVVTVQATPTVGSGSETVAPTAVPVAIGNGSATNDRIEEMLNGPGDAPSLTVRGRVFRDAFDGWLRRPLLGWGSGSFPMVYPPPLEGGYWIANVVLHTLFDTGIVGFALLAGAVVVAGWRALRSIRYPVAQWDEQAFVVFGLLSAGIGLLAAYQVTDGSWLGFTWVLVGMLASVDVRMQSAKVVGSQ